MGITPIQTYAIISVMDKKSKILLWVVIIGSVISVGLTFYKTIIQNDFEVVNTVSDTENNQ